MRKTIHRLLLATVCGAALIGAAFAQQAPSVADYASAEDPPVFDTPAKAADAFKAVLAANDFDGLAKLLGLDAAKLKSAEGVMDNYEQIRANTAKKLVAEDIGGGRTILNIGDVLWPLPFPITKGEDGKWAFDTYAGLEEIINRRVGENEIEAIASARAYVDAQQDYATEDRDGDGVMEYAQKLVSSEGKTDGLYWPPEQGDGDSPAGEFVDQAALDKAKAGQGYFGYRFRILTAQGSNVAGGAHSYVVNGNMISGFALIAWPVEYGETGVQTFVVNNSGIVYERDLGPKTDKIVAGIKSFNPDDKWSIEND
jgi:hypothetical protein